MKNEKIIAIAKLIKSHGKIIDIGSDHALLSINLLKVNKVKHVYNIEINKKPLDNTIKNLKSYGLLDKTTNILADGLKTDLIKDKIDVCVIAGVGAKTIIDILTNANPNIKIKKFILSPNNNVPSLREYLSKNFFKFEYETIILDNKIYYEIMIVSKTKLKKLLTERQCYFGKYNLLHPSKEYKQMHLQRFNFITNRQLHKHNENIAHELKLLTKEKTIK